MIGIVVVCHGNLAREFIAALEHIVGPQQNLCGICIGAEDDMDARRRDILDCVAKVDSGAGVAVLTDMFGGTPSNLALSVMDQAHVEVVAGVNLPMLVRLASIRTTRDLADAVESAQEAGRKYINVASNLLSEPNNAAAADADDRTRS
jgi:PTS system mannose-specific IIA component